MGLFNTVTADVECPRCGGRVTAEVQFQFGDLWDYQYRVGDAIRLRDDQRWALQKRVVAEGVARVCPRCAEPFLDIDVVIDNGVITGTRTHEVGRSFPPDEPWVVEE